MRVLVSRIHSVDMRKRLLGRMEDLSLDSYLISYIGQFDLPKDLFSEVHGYGSVSSGLLLYVTCQAGKFAIDLIQDFESTAYVDAFIAQLEQAGVPFSLSDAIAFETPRDELAEVVAASAEVEDERRGWGVKLASALRESAQAAKQRAEAAQAGRPIEVAYYDLASGELRKKTLGAGEDLNKELDLLIENAPSLLVR